METAQRTRNDKGNHSSDHFNNAEILESGAGLEFDTIGTVSDT